MDMLNNKIEKQISNPKLHIWYNGKIDDDFREVLIPKEVQQENYRLRLLLKLVDACPDSISLVRRDSNITFIPSNIPDTPWHTDIGLAIARDFRSDILEWMPEGQWQMGVIYINDDDFDNERMRILAIMQYKDYLKTPEWQQQRQEHLYKAGYRCQVCNTNDRRLDVHHRTYDRRGNERYEDLIVLCEDCHSLFHRKGKLSRY